MNGSHGRPERWYVSYIDLQLLCDTVVLLPLDRNLCSQVGGGGGGGHNTLNRDVIESVKRK